MGYNVEKLFEDARNLSKVNNKKAYQGNMEMFNSNRYAYLKDLVDAGDDNLQSQAQSFCEEVTSAFKKFGKVRGGDLMDLNYFMVFYVFPAIQQNEENEKAIRICDILRDTWNQHFKSNISYADYDTLLDGFQTKIFGVPVGKN